MRDLHLTKPTVPGGWRTRNSLVITLLKSDSARCAKFPGSLDINEKYLQFLHGAAGTAFVPRVNQCPLSCQSLD